MAIDDSFYVGMKGRTIDELRKRGGTWRWDQPTRRWIRSDGVSVDERSFMESWHDDKRCVTRFVSYSANGEPYSDSGHISMLDLPE